MDSMDSLWNIESNNVTLDLDQAEIVETFSLSDVQPISSDQEIVLEEQVDVGVKRSHDENLNSSYIQQSKVVILSDLSGQEQEPLVTFNLPTATNSHPRLENSPGLYGFSVSFSTLEERVKNKTWEWSQQLNKLYSDMDRWVLVEFTAPAGFFIRALPVFSLPSDIRRPVKRCPSHAALEDKTNKDFPFPDHLIRVEGEDAIYQEDSTSGRLSVVFPVLAQEAGSQLDSRLIKFMCLGSDPGGINRRPVKLVFTLEDGSGLVVGRQVVELRLCSNPKRDKLKEEEKHQQKEETARNIAHRWELYNLNSNVWLISSFILQCQNLSDQVSPGCECE